MDNLGPFEVCHLSTVYDQYVGGVYWRTVEYGRDGHISRVFLRDFVTLEKSNVFVNVSL